MSNTNVPGSGTAWTIGDATGAGLAAEESKVNVPPAPMVKLDPSRKAAFEARVSVPALTVVPPL